MGQISVEIMRLHGSLLSGNQHPKKNSDVSSNTHFDALKRIKDKQPQILVEDIEIQGIRELRSRPESVENTSP